MKKAKMKEAWCLAMAVEKIAPLLAALEHQIAKHAVFKQHFDVL